MNFILENIVSSVVGLFRDFLLKQVLLTIQVGDKVDALRHDAAILKEKCQTVNNAVEAQERGTSKKCTAEVQGWQRRAEEIHRISQEIEVDYENRNCMLGTWCSLNCCSNYSISVRTINVHQRVKDDLDFIAKVTDFVAEVAPPSVQETNTPVAPASASGQLKAMQEKALSFIHKDTQGTLGIWGMGGVGKTTTLQLINNSLMADTFTVIFVVASSGCTEEKLMELIAENQGLSKEGDLKKTIFNFLKRKDFVLLVDDLWDRLKLEDIGIPLPLGTYNGHRRKLILTTRDLVICGGMGVCDTDNVIKLECLKWEEAWALFQKNVGEGLLHSNPELEDLAKKVAGECDGHPLALITIGQAMAHTGDAMVWEDALKKLRMSRMHEITDHSGHGGTTSRNTDPILLLKVSYDYLHPPRLKDCFLHCALWPEDHRIKKNALIEFWMGHGLLSNELDDVADVYEEGQVIIDKLLKACLLENVEESYKVGRVVNLKNSRVKMLDLTRDMALWVARECGANKKKWQVLTDHGKEEASEEAHKISIISTKTKVLTSRIRNWPNLTTLILRHTSSLKDEDVTNIQYCSLLKYLDVSSNYEITSFPVEVCKLDKLEYLNFSNTQICTVPEEAKSLVNLRVLLFRGAPIDSIPYGMLANMSRLFVLDISVPDPVDQSEIINGLDCMSSPPKALGINVSTDSGFHKLASLSGVSMTSLNVHTMEKSSTISLLSEDFLGKLHMHSDLRMLSISNCKGLEHLVLQTRSRCRLGTEILKLYELTVLKEIIWRNVQPRDVLPKLRYIGIRNCNILQDVSWVAQLPCLEHLTVYKCASLRCIVGEQVVVEPLAFRSLRILTLFRLQNLRSICDQESVFPSLEHLVVAECPELKKLPFGSPASFPKLQNITGNKNWWGSLVMEETLRTSLRPLYQELNSLGSLPLRWHRRFHKET